MANFLLWIKSIFVTLNQFVNNKLLVFEKNDRINSWFETKEVDAEVVNAIILYISDVLVIMIFFWIIKKIVSFLFNSFRRDKNTKKNRQRQFQKGGGTRRKVHRERNRCISNLLSKFKSVIRKTNSSSNGYINGRLGYDEYDDDYSYDEPEELHVKHQARRRTRIKNSDRENTMYIPNEYYRGNTENAVKQNQAYSYNQQTVYGTGASSGQPIYGNRYGTRYEGPAVYRGETPKPQQSEYANDTLEFSLNEQNNDDGKTRIFKRK